MQRGGSSCALLEVPGAVWQDKHSVDACSGRRCRRRFNRLFCAKHHCQWCGRVFCDACAPRQIVRSGKLLRRCSSCRLPIIFKHFWNAQKQAMDCTPFECIVSFLTPRSITALLQSCHTMMAEYPVCGYPFLESIQERFPSYYTGAQVGRGSFGTVYKCEDRLAKDRRRVILKCVLKSSNLTYTRWCKAITELRILASVEHRNVARLLEAFQTREHLVIVMEAGEGGTVRQGYEYVRQHRLPLAAFTANIIEGVAAGLDYLYHEKHIVHRDIKLDNIVLSADYATPMIIDFGLAEYIVQEEGQWFVVGGTRNYAPPESIGAIAAGHLDIRETGLTMHKGDIFSLGVVAYILLTAHRPFQNKVRFDLQYEEMEKGVSCSGPLWDGTSSAAQALVRAMLSFSPPQRPCHADIKASPFIESRAAGVAQIREARLSGLLEAEKETRDQWVTLEPSEMQEEDTDIFSLATPQRWYHTYLPRTNLHLW
ncbi:putative protein kinase [Leptomonas seymouri]|uniref:Protein kinase n=1 Tax=Leptomonas seymouri TaxID=5684 RepID=A0A0N0P7K3_LEPSE|nr:putative protein kinase [Leptomonas seymouri]|eukprot:KPI88889.1 putative protein kinase [Leptomonas seymouri]